MNPSSQFLRLLTVRKTQMPFDLQTWHEKDQSTVYSVLCTYVLIWRMTFWCTYVSLTSALWDFTVKPFLFTGTSFINQWFSGFSFKRKKRLANTSVSSFFVRFIVCFIYLFLKVSGGSFVASLLLFVRWKFKMVDFSFAIDSFSFLLFYKTLFLLFW